MAEILADGSGTLLAFHLKYMLENICPMMYYAVSFDIEENWDGLIECE